MTLYTLVILFCVFLYFHNEELIKSLQKIKEKEYKDSQIKKIKDELNKMLYRNAISFLIMQVSISIYYFYKYNIRYSLSILHANSNEEIFKYLGNNFYIFILMVLFFIFINIILLLVKKVKIKNKTRVISFLYNLFINCFDVINQLLVFNSMFYFLNISQLF